MIDLIYIFETTNKIIDFAEKIKKLLGLMEDIDETIMNLAKSELDAGIRHLKNASNTTIQELRIDYIKQALTPLMRAISIEENERLVCAYLGLAACYDFLNDRQNVRQYLSEFAKKDIILKYKMPMKPSDFLNVFNALKSFENGFNFINGLTTLDLMVIDVRNYPFSKIFRNEKTLEKFIEAWEKVTFDNEILRACKRQLKILQLQRQAREEVQRQEREEIEQYKLLDI